MVFKEQFLNNEINPSSNNNETKPREIYRTEKERFELAENAWIDSMPVSVLNLSKVVREELEYFIEKNFSDKKIEEITIGEIIKNYSELKDTWKKNYFLEIEAEIKHCQDASRELINKNKI